MSGADDDDEEEGAGSDVGSWDSGSRPKQALKGVPKHRPSRTQHRGRKRPRRRRHSSEEEEEGSDEERGASGSGLFCGLLLWWLSGVRCPAAGRWGRGGRS